MKTPPPKTVFVVYDDEGIIEVFRTKSKAKRFLTDLKKIYRSTMNYKQYNLAEEK